MKRIFCFLLICIAGLNINAKAQAKVDDAKAMAMLKEFYLVYNDAWAFRGTKKVVSKKLYALHDKYLTKKYNAYLRKTDIIDDPLRGDDLTEGKNLKRLRVTKDPKRANTYFVNYIVPVKSMEGMTFNVDVMKHILVANEGGKPKIAEVLFGK